MTGNILFQAIVFLAGAVVCVPIAKRFGLSAVLGYLLAGILIGPFLLGFVGEEGEDILHFAEFGVVMMLVVTAITMTLTPILAILNERLVLPRFGTRESIDRPMDEVEKASKVILVGFSHFGTTVGRFLRAFGVEPTVLDFDSNRVDFLRKMGFKVFYGDASRMDLLESAGIAEADMLISTIGSPEVTADLVKQVRAKYPHVKLMIRAQNRYDAYELLNMGVEHVYRESLDTSVKLASDVLSEMGFRKYTLHRQAQQFIRADEESLRRLASQPRNEEAYIFKAREEIAAQERLLEEDRKRGLFEEDHMWDSEQMRMVKQ
jgi:monovalent cation:H+ antiporter-2, CPA2 family